MRNRFLDMQGDETCLESVASLSRRCRHSRDITNRTAVGGIIFGKATYRYVQEAIAKNVRA